MSAYLFIMVVELLAHKIRKSNDIKGIAIGTTERKLDIGHTYTSNLNPKCAGWQNMNQLRRDQGALINGGGWVPR